MGGRNPEGYITDPRNTRMEETSRRQRRMGASSEGCQRPKGAVTPYMKCNMAYGATYMSSCLRL